MNRFKKCWIIGAGAIGSTLAAFLSQNDGRQAVLVGSSEHWQKIRESGLVWECMDAAPKNIDLATARPEEVPALGAGDLVLLTGKLPDLDKVAGWLAPKLAPDTGVIALQNGLGVQELAHKLLGRPVDRGLAFYGAHSPIPGRVKYFYQGRLRLHHTPVAEALCAMLGQADLKCKLVEDFAPVEWLKLAINCLANPLAGMLGASSRMTADTVLDPAKTAILQEVITVAAAENIPLDFTVEQYNRILTPDENVPSLKTDLDRGRPTEIEYLNGAICRIGRKHHIPTPVNDLVVSLIHYIEAGQLESGSAQKSDG